MTTTVTGLSADHLRSTPGSTTDVFTLHVLDPVGS